MSEIFVMGYDAKLAEKNGKPMGPVDRIVNIVSDLTHMELQFSSRYHNLSYSATTIDGPNCSRFKDIKYSHLMERWVSRKILVSEIEEETMFFTACLRAGTPYDVVGVTSLATKLNIIKPDPQKTWCSKEVLIVLKSALPVIGDDDVTPDDADAQIERFIELQKGNKPTAKEMKFIKEYKEPKYASHSPQF